MLLLPWLNGNVLDSYSNSWTLLLFPTPEHTRIAPRAAKSFRDGWNESKNTASPASLQISTLKG